jgi:uncharacterized protein YjbI with pentapeptide repeats
MRQIPSNSRTTAIITSLIFDHFRSRLIRILPKWSLQAVPEITLLYATLRYSTLLYSTLLYATLRYSTLLYNTLRYSTLLYGTLRYSTLLYATLRYSTLLYATLRYSTKKELLSWYNSATVTEFVIIPPSKNDIFP